MRLLLAALILSGTADGQFFGGGGARPSSTNTWSALQTFNSGTTRMLGYGDWVRIATPGGNPAAGDLRIYAKTGAGICWKDEAGTETCAGAGAGSSTGAQLAAADFTPTRTSSTILTLPAIAANAFRIGEVGSAAVASSTFTVTSGTGTLWIALGSDGAVAVRHNIVGACSATCTAVASSTGFLPTDLPLYQWGVTTGALDAAPGTLKLTPYNSRPLVAGTNVSFGHTAGVTTINSTGGGDASTNTATSVDGEAVLFSGTGGKTLKRSTLTGVLKSTGGVTAAVTGTASDCVKVDGSSGSCGGTSNWRQYFPAAHFTTATNKESYGMSTWVVNGSFSGEAPHRWGYLEFPDSASNYAVFHLTLPFTPSALTLNAKWINRTAGSGDIRVESAAICVAAGETHYNPTYNASTLATLTMSSNNFTVQWKPSPAITGCLVDEEMYVKVGRVGGDAADTFTATDAVGLLGVLVDLAP